MPGMRTKASRSRAERPPAQRGIGAIDATNAGCVIRAGAAAVAAIRATVDEDDVMATASRIGREREGAATARR
jgi:thiamine monophosphate synthase